jgi:hypothetical protein
MEIDFFQALSETRRMVFPYPSYHYGIGSHVVHEREDSLSEAFLQLFDLNCDNICPLDDEPIPFRS